MTAHPSVTPYIVDPNRDRPGFVIVTVCCPHCGRAHRHGGPERGYGGHRTADCGRGGYVVHELASAGMSTRAIAPVVGVSPRTAAYDLEAGVQDCTPEPAVNTETGEVSDEVRSLTARVARLEAHDAAHAAELHRLKQVCR